MLRAVERDLRRHIIVDKATNTRKSGALRVIVIGCGVSGLSTGIRLLERGYEVEIWARELPPNTTSNVAAAIWHPFRAFPVELVVSWGQRTFEVLHQLAEAPETGIRLMEALEIYRRAVPEPWWRPCVADFRRPRVDELPSGFVDGYVFETVMVETGIYLGYLARHFERLGGKIVQRELDSIGEPFEFARTVVNCAGLGARQLVGDDRLVPMRGQIARIELPPVGRILLDEEGEQGITYIVPRSTDCILGGTVDVGNWSLEPDMATAEAIIERCARLVPEVRDARVLEHLVGLRPGRDAVRLEAEPQPGGGLLVHNYGHGGAGITLSWGCAEEATRLVDLHHS